MRSTLLSVARSFLRHKVAMRDVDDTNIVYGLDHRIRINEIRRNTAIRYSGTILRLDVTQTLLTEGGIHWNCIVFRICSQRSKIVTV